MATNIAAMTATVLAVKAGTPPQTQRAAVTAAVLDATA